MLVAAMMLTFVGPIEAAFFQGTTSTNFKNPSLVGSTTTIVNGVPTSTFTTGIGQPNSLTMTGTSFDVVAESSFNIAHLVYFNGSTDTNTAAINVDVDESLTFTSPFNETKTSTFSFHFELTPNSTGDPILDADILTPINVFSQQAFAYGGVSYSLKLLGFSIGSNLVSQFVLPEGSTVESNLIGTITTEPNPNLPEPSTFIILGMGAISLLAYAWRRRK
jgi:hypothetical protein